MEVDQHHRGLLAGLAGQPVAISNGLRAASRNSWPIRLITTTGVPSAVCTRAVPLPGAAAAWLAGRMIRGSAVEEGIDLALAVGVVSERDRVHAGREQAGRDAAGDADSVGRVLAVGDDQVERHLVTQAGQLQLDRPPSRCAEDVGDEQDSHLMVMESTIYSSGLAPGAGLIWIETWLPASEV